MFTNNLDLLVYVNQIDSSLRTWSWKGYLLFFQFYRRSLCQGLQPVTLIPSSRGRGYGFYQSLGGKVLSCVPIMYIAHCWRITPETRMH